MVKIIKENNKITISGHAGSGEYGKDIVCASVSSICYTTINAIEKLRKSYIKVTDNDDLVIEVLKEDEIVKGLIANMMELFVTLQEDYPKNVNVKES